MDATAGSALPGEARTTVIEAERGIGFPKLSEVWAYRDLLYLLIRRDVAVRYKQTSVGVAWAILQPIAFAVVFSVFLGHLAKVPSQPGISYAIYAYSGMIMWLLFSKSFAGSAESTVASAQLISKVWFPRLVIPFAAAVPGLVDFALGLVVLLVALPIYGEPYHLQILLVPFAGILCMLVGLAGGLWFSALNVRYRDVQHIVPFLILVGLFITPVMYPFDLVPSNLQPLYALNPVVGVLELYRWMVFGTLTAPVGVIVIPVVTSALAIASGLVYFRSASRTFADVI